MSDYQTLLQVGEDWLSRTDSDTVSMGDTFIRIAENRIARDCVAAHLRKRETWNFTTQEYALPDDFLNFISVPFKLVAPHALYESEAYTETGETSLYTIDGNTLVVAPFSAPFSVDVTYRARFPRLSSENSTTTFLTNNEDIYYHAIRAAICEKTQDDEQEIKFEAKYRDAVQRANTQASWGQYSGNELRRS